jgi:hypothetical protein
MYSNNMQISKCGYNDSFTWAIIAKYYMYTNNMQISKCGYNDSFTWAIMSSCTSYWKNKFTFNMEFWFISLRNVYIKKTTNIIGLN